MGENDHEMEDISAEINLVIDERVNQLKRLHESFGVYDDAHILVKEQLKKVENRNYLWMSLIFPELKKVVGHRQDQLLEAVRQIPKSLDEAYDRILKNSFNVEEARRLLHIVCAACRPLTLKEMNWALAVGRSLSTGYASTAGIFRGHCQRSLWLFHKHKKRENLSHSSNGKGVFDSRARSRRACPSRQLRQ